MKEGRPTDGESDIIFEYRFTYVHRCSPYNHMQARLVFGRYQNKGKKDSYSPRIAYLVGLDGSTVPWCFAVSTEPSARVDFFSSLGSDECFAPVLSFRSSFCSVDDVNRWSTGSWAG